MLFFNNKSQIISLCQLKPKLSVTRCFTLRQLKSKNSKKPAYLCSDIAQSIVVEKTHTGYARQVLILFNNSQKFSVLK